MYILTYVLNRYLFNKYLHVNDKVVTLIKISAVNIYSHTTPNAPNVIKISGVTALVLLLRYWMYMVISQAHEILYF